LCSGHQASKKTLDSEEIGTERSMSSQWNLVWKTKEKEESGEKGKINENRAEKVNAKTVLIKRKVLKS
jgi:hypothetical protein